jgi:hypothetical protein
VAGNLSVPFRATTLWWQARPKGKYEDRSGRLLTSLRLILRAGVGFILRLGAWFGLLVFRFILCSFHCFTSYQDLKQVWSALQAEIFINKRDLRTRGAATSARADGDYKSRAV